MRELSLGSVFVSTLILFTTKSLFAWTNGQIATYVLGQPDFTSNTAVAAASGMSLPGGVAYSTSTQQLFVADHCERVLVFDLSSGITNGMNARYVLGEPNFTSNTV